MKFEKNTAMTKKEELNFNKNEDVNRLLVSDLNRKLDQVYLGGGEKKIAKHHSKGKLTARERIAYLLDKKTESIEKSPKIRSDKKTIQNQI